MRHTAHNTTAGATPYVDSVLGHALNYISIRKARIPETHTAFYSRIFVRRWKASYVLSLLMGAEGPAITRDAVQYNPVFLGNLSMDALRALVAAPGGQDLELWLNFRKPKNNLGTYVDSTARVLLSVARAPVSAVDHTATF